MKKIATLILMMGIAAAAQAAPFQSDTVRNENSFNSGKENNPGKHAGHDPCRKTCSNAGGNGHGHTAPVPEPETYGMLLAGLGVMTAVARRRKKSGE